MCQTRKKGVCQKTEKRIALCAISKAFVVSGFVVTLAIHGCILTALR